MNAEGSQAAVSIELLRHECTTAFARVWEASFGVEIELLGGKSPVNAEFPWMGAVAWIGGNWTGNVQIALPHKLARFLTEHLLGSTQCNDEEIGDALREIVNMTAGNLKSALPGKCGLATPGNFEVQSLAELEDDHSVVIVNRYQYLALPLVVVLSALHPFA